MRTGNAKRGRAGQVEDVGIRPGVLDGEDQRVGTRVGWVRAPAPSVRSHRHSVGVAPGLTGWVLSTRRAEGQDDGTNEGEE